MSMSVTSMAKIPSQGFDWYVLFLEDRWDDQLRQELVNNFVILGQEVGPDVLVVRGHDVSDFFNQAFEIFALYDKKWKDQIDPPALLVTNIPPAEIEDDRQKLEKAKVILLPLGPRYMRPGSITNVLRELASSLHSTDAMNALQTLDRPEIENRWGWITRYFDLRPNFMGFGVNINQVIDDMTQQKRK